MLNLNDVFAEARAIAKADAALKVWTMADLFGDINNAWEAIEILATSEDFLPYAIGKTNQSKVKQGRTRVRTDALTIKANYRRRNQLRTWINDEVDTKYGEFYEAELRILDAYAFKSLMDMMEIHPEFLDDINRVRKEIADAKAKAKEEARLKAEAEAQAEAEMETEVEAEVSE